MRRVFSRGHSKSSSRGSRELGRRDSHGYGLTPVKPVPRDEGDTTEASNALFEVGVSSDCNRRYRKSMEDASVVILDYLGVQGCAYFGIFDGHAGPQCAKACAQSLHVVLAEVITAQPEKKDIPQALATSFKQMDERLVDLNVKHSGSTAVVAVSCYVADEAIVPPSTPGASRKLYVANVGDSRAVLGEAIQLPGGPAETVGGGSGSTRTSSRAESMSASASSGASRPASGSTKNSKASDDDITAAGTPSSSGSTSKSNSTPPQSPRRDRDRTGNGSSISSPSPGPGLPRAEPPSPGRANSLTSQQTVEDSIQAEIWEARRLSYDHRCSDVNEQRRVANAGGLMMNNRVNGMLAVTRSLGDLFMKDYVVGAPYTTETDLSDDPELLVMACDGLWDVCSDDKAIQLVQAAGADGATALATSEKLLSYALKEFSTDNLTVMVVRFKRTTK